MKIKNLDKKMAEIFKKRPKFTVDLRHNETYIAAVFNNNLPPKM